MLDFIYDSTGENIGYFLNGHLWTLQGQHVTRFLVTQGIFINRRGHYIGEMHLERLVCNTLSQYGNVPYGDQGNQGKMGEGKQMPATFPIQLPRGYATFDHNNLG